MRSEDMHWDEMHCGRITKHEIKKYVSQQKWQLVREDMKGASLEYKYKACREWLRENKYSRDSYVQVTNYINALSRGGLIKPSDYMK
jgi:hypothetical protein